MPSSDPTGSPARIIGRYELHDVLASGGMATVHLGRLLGPVGFSRTVAIKRLHAQFARDPEFVSMFLDEARLAARIRHPNVVPTLDVVATEEELFLVMDYVPGESLSRLAAATFAASARFPLRAVVSIMAGALHGLHAAHEAKSERGEPLGIVHRDVSPQNILVGIDGVARVLDFGVAKAAGRVQTTRDGHIKGKLSYMSPEQLRGDIVTRQTDIYAAGIVLWEVLTGQRLFKGDNAGAILLKVLEGKTEPPSKFVHASMGATLKADEIQAFQRLDEIVLRALDPDSARRFATAREFALALERNLPSAPASEVAEWVESTASHVLATRAELVAGIESGTMNVPAAHRIMSALHKAAAETTPGARQGPSRPGKEPGSDPPTATLLGSGGSGSQASALSASAPIVERPPSRRGSWLALVALLVVGGVVTTGLWMRKTGESSPHIVATPSDRVPAVKTPIPAPDPTPDPTPPPTTTAETASAQAAAPTSPPPAPLATGRTRKGGAPSRATGGSSPPSDRGASFTPPAPTPPQPAAAPALNCAPPYYFDDKGFKHIKPGCV